MNLEDVLKYGHHTVLHTLSGLTEEQCSVGGVCGHWSVREIIQHLASHEIVVGDILLAASGSSAPTPTLDLFIEQGQEIFNDAEVAKRQSMTYTESLREYEHAASRTQEWVSQVPPAVRRQVGTLPWYGAEYDLEDLVAYSSYGHKREHCAQINVYRDTLKR